MQIIESEIQQPKVTTLTYAQREELEARKLKDLKAKNYLFQKIDRPIPKAILCKETLKDIWDSMKKKYQGFTRVKRAQLQALRKDFETLEIKEGEFVTNYCARTMEITNKMQSKDIDELSLDDNYSEEVEVEAEKGEDKEEIMEAEISA
ncbi:hypothetical protein KY284_005124 [Solanum tuberosum]|nr:hypothetical protein KY284_005124 [Solanum tuberosum]